MHEKKFFAALIVSKNFRDGILDTSTRIATAKAGYLGQSLDINPNDEEILRKIGEVKNESEFAAKYDELK